MLGHRRPDFILNEEVLEHPRVKGWLKLKIINLETIPLNNRGMLLRIQTDEGLVGLGSPMNYEHGRTVAQAIKDMGEYSSADPLQIEDH